MNILFHKEIDGLKRQILALSAKVENDVGTAVRAADNLDESAAKAVIKRECQTDTMEVDVEEECLKILALHQPVASDLRYIVAVLKINQDLERIGDLAEHIAERALFLCHQPRIAIPVRLEEMANKTQLLLKKVLDAFVNFDESAAREVCAADNEVDNMNQEIFQQVKEAIMKNPLLFEPLIQIMHIARHLERISDHVTNIAEDLIYLIEGKIVRHQTMVQIVGKAGLNPASHVS
jgi:phosphate transport system protein